MTSHPAALSDAAPPRPVLPHGLPEPVDDGTCAHLPGRALPDIALPGSHGEDVVLARLPGWSVVYCYPISGEDDSILPDGWDLIPGARGCSPQSCSFRDHAAELAALGARVFGLATQPPAYLAGEVARLHLPFPLLSDATLAFQRALALPLHDVPVAGSRVLRRVTLICAGGTIRDVHYPVFPPDRAAEATLARLRVLVGAEGEKTIG
ncbi:peroxiredoxin [Salinarimonas chemoclinalis]|uniref:peroxiredoxin n=1 Tax=Salinarimonas chemoclinalis TaxID=3241599 RepID=UPI003556471E